MQRPAGVQATVAAGTRFPCVAIRQCAPVSLDVSNTPKLDDGAADANAVPAAMHRVVETHATLFIVAMLFGNDTRVHERPALLET
jgi:hypothetical protein